MKSRQDNLTSRTSPKSTFSRSTENINSPTSKKDDTAHLLLSRKNSPQVKSYGNINKCAPHMIDTTKRRAYIFDPDTPVLTLTEIQDQVPTPKTARDIRSSEREFNYKTELPTQKSIVPKPQEKPVRDFSGNIELYESVENSRMIGINDSVSRLSNKELNERLQLGELKLMSLDNKITQCLENSRRALSGTVSPDRGAYARTEILSPTVKSVSTGNVNVRSWYEPSLKSLPLTRETTGEEVYQYDGGKTRKGETEGIRNIYKEGKTEQYLWERVDELKINRKPERSSSSKSNPNGRTQENKVKSPQADVVSVENMGKEASRTHQPIRIVGLETNGNGNILIEDVEKKDEVDNNTLHPVRSKSCSTIPEIVPIEVIKDKIESFAQKGFLSTKNNGREINFGMKQKDFTFKDLLSTISPSIKKIKMLMPSEYDKIEDKVASLQTIGLLSPKEFDVHSIASIKEDAGRSPDQDYVKGVKNNIVMTNTSNDYKTIEELKDFLSLLQNLDFQTALYTENSIVSHFELKDKQGDQRNKNILEIDEVYLEEEKEISPYPSITLENKTPVTTAKATPEQKTQAQGKIERPVSQEKGVKKSVTPAKPRIQSHNKLRIGEEIETVAEVKKQFQPLHSLKSPQRMGSETSRRADSRMKIQVSPDKGKGHGRNISEVGTVPQSARERMKVYDRLVDDAKKKLEEQGAVTQRESSKENKENTSKVPAKKVDQGTIQNLVVKLLKDAERRRESVEKARIAKEEEEERKAFMLTNLIFTNKNNKAESKVRQYIRRNRERVELGAGSETHRVERTGLGPEKSPKKVSFSIEKSPQRMGGQEHVENTLYRKITKTVGSLSTVGTVGVSLEKDIREIKKLCSKKEREMNLEYLKGLRNDIEKIKENIEEKIQGIEKEANIGGENNGKQTTKGILKKAGLGAPGVSRSTNNSIERMHERSQKSRVKTRFQNSSSRILQYMSNNNIVGEGEQKRSNNQTPVDLNTLGNVCISARSVRSRDQGTPRKWFNGEQKRKEVQQGKLSFMDDTKAMSYVNQLISELKDVKSVKSPRMNKQ